MSVLRIPAVIDRYLASYAAMDVNAMLACLDEGATFANIQHGALTHAASGRAEWRKLAEASLGAFAARRIVPKRIEKMAGYWVIDGRFEATLARDFGPEAKAGSAIAFDVVVMLHLHGGGGTCGEGGGDDGTIVSVLDIS